jgi:hypothetical protein
MVKSKPDLPDGDASLQICDDNLGSLTVFPSIPAKVKSHFGEFFFPRAPVINVKMDGLERRCARS